jgi:ATP-dependent protease HslVU (ClpYQ) peptidase subunit
MTVIAWDGKTLAADKRSVNQGYAATVTKVFRSNDCLLAISGCLARAHAMYRWFVAGQDLEKFPKETTDDWALLLVVFRDGTVWKYESREHPFVIESQVCAGGSGRDFALMAMHLGYDARRAVELTCELSVDCGNGIDTLTFEDVP